MKNGILVSPPGSLAGAWMGVESLVLGVMARLAKRLGVPHLKLVEWTGAGFGVGGAAVLALNLSISPAGFVGFLISNIFWIVWSRAVRAEGLLFQQLAFTATSILGIYRGFFASVPGCS